MKILVAGSSGLVGSAVVRELKKMDLDVLGISTKNVNLLDRTATFDFVRKFKPDAIIDAAAKVGGIGGNNAFPVDFLTQNLQIQCNLMDAAHSASVNKFVFLASSCIYPRDCPQPIKEEYILTGKLEETNSAYAIAKLAGIELIKSYRKQFGHKWISVMPTNIYGPNDNFDLETSHVFPALIKKFLDAKVNDSDAITLWGTGSPRREFLHADDLASAILLCLNLYDADNQINIGTGTDITIKELATKIASAVGFEGEIKWDTSRHDGTPQKVLDISKINNLGWSPKISLDDGLKATIKWYLENK
jgi:GDP-L-fucose synthase